MRRREGKREKREMEGRSEIEAREKWGGDEDLSLMGHEV